MGKMTKKKQINGKKRKMENDSDYDAKRKQNNLAVKKSREKTKNKTKETEQRVKLLKQDNARMEERLKLLAKEFTFLKNLFLAQDGYSHGINIDSDYVNELVKQEVVEDEI